MHSLFICITAFQHSARHKTTWQGQRRDAATGQVAPIYNVIDFVICRQSHKRLLVDSRTYAGTLLDSDHRLLTAKVDLTQLYNVWGRIEKVRTSKRVRYNTCLLANEPYRAKFWDAVSEALPEINTNASASERWNSVENIVKEAAESTIGLTAPTGLRDTPHCPEMAAMSAEQRKLNYGGRTPVTSTIKRS